MVYEPREDSELLAGVVKRLARGKTIDIGTGTGVQARTAMQSEDVASIEAVDIDPEAVERAKQMGVEATQADLFEGNNDVYDTIICNAPYLPEDKRASDVALDGGEKGYEWTLRFLEEAKEHLERDGQILLLISTLTNQHVVEDAIITHGLIFEVMARKKISFEELMVYRITWAVPDRPKAKFLARGKRSRVYREGDHVLKVTERSRIAQEAKMLQDVNELGIGPKYVKHTDRYVEMEYVEGTRIDEYLKECSPEDAQELLRSVEAQLEVLDEAGINKAEMTNPYKHIIITEDGPILIDWERAKHTDRTQNLNQFKEYRKRIAREHPRLAGAVHGH